MRRRSGRDGFDEKVMGLGARAIFPTWLSLSPLNVFKIQFLSGRNDLYAVVFDNELRV